MAGYQGPETIVSKILQMKPLLTDRLHKVAVATFWSSQWEFFYCLYPYKTANQNLKLRFGKCNWREESEKKCDKW